MAQERPPFSYTVGRAMHWLAGRPAAGVRATVRGLDLTRDAAVRGLSPLAAGLHGLDPDVTGPPPAPPPSPKPPRGLVGSTALDPTRSIYADPAAVETLREAAPAPAPAPAQKQVAGHLQRGQTIMSGGMRSFPNKGEYSEAYLRSLNPESFADLMGRRKLTAEVQTAELGARGPEELARVAGAQQDLVDYDTATRAPGRQAGLLRLKQLEFEHPVSQAQREELARQTYMRYGYPQEVSGRYALERQGLVNQGLDARTRLEQEGLDRRDQAESARADAKNLTDRRTQALRSLGALEAKKTDPYAPTMYASPYEEAIANEAFPEDDPAAGGSSEPMFQSPEQVADIIRARFPGMKDYRQVIGWLEANGHMTDVTPEDRQRILAALNVK